MYRAQSVSAFLELSLELVEAVKFSTPTTWPCVGGCGWDRLPGPELSWDRRVTGSGAGGGGAELEVGGQAASHQEDARAAAQRGVLLALGPRRENAHHPRWILSEGLSPAHRSPSWEPHLLTCLSCVILHVGLWSLDGIV